MNFVKNPMLIKITELNNGVAPTHCSYDPDGQIDYADKDGKLVAIVKAMADNTKQIFMPKGIVSFEENMPENTIVTHKVSGDIEIHYEKGDFLEIRKPVPSKDSKAPITEYQRFLPV